MDGVGARACAGSEPLEAARGRRRAAFWRNVVRQLNFPREAERALLLSLTRGADWTRPSALSAAFIDRHREIYHLIAHGEYERSGMIQRDVTRTFSIFARGERPATSGGLETQHGALRRVLNAIAEAEGGYCQGMNFIAALFLVQGLDEADAYALFLYLLRARHLSGIFHRSSTFLDEYLRQFELMFRRALPDLFLHMDAQGFSIPMFGIEWFTTLFSVSTKLDVACAVLDMFLAGVPDIFLRTGLAILKLLEAKLLCMASEDFLREFKPWVQQLDPYQVVMQALAFPPNDPESGLDTAEVLARTRSHKEASPPSILARSSSSAARTPPRAFDLHRSLPPELAEAVRAGAFAVVRQRWEQCVRRRPCAMHCRVLANEILHCAVWHGRVSIACFALECCGADVDDADDAGLTPLHFSAVRNEPDMARLLLAHGADGSKLGGEGRGGRSDGLTALETARCWRYRDTAAVRLVLEGEVCLWCNTRFDVLALESDTCARCQLRYCRRPHAQCVDTHQCPREFRRRARDGSSSSKALAAILAEEGGGGQRDGNQFQDAAEDSECLSPDACGASDSASASESGTAKTRSTSESSSIVFVSSPSSPESVSPSALHLDDRRLADWLSRSPLPSPARRDSSSARLALGLQLQFPDRPHWYCNAPGCHAVFGLFTPALACDTCGGVFCSSDSDASTRRCLRCLQRSPSPRTTH